MTLTRSFITTLLVAAVGLSGCTNILATLGLRDAPPPVTDSAYFNGQLEKLLDQLQANKSRNFRKAAPLDFLNADGRRSELGKILTTKFGERAIAKNHFKIVPPGQVAEALNKLKIVFKGELTKQQAKQIGDELEADAVITGVIYDLQKGSDVDLTVNAIQVESGDLISAASVNIYRSKQVQTLIQQF